MISARVDPGVLAAAAARLGLSETDVSDVVNASLALAAAPDSFKAWLKDPGDPLPDDFELAICGGHDQPRERGRRGLDPQPGH